jgi:ribosomal protein L37AE/L43A
MKFECVECGDDFNPKRFKLGYRTCIECGEEIAMAEKLRKSRCVAPAYNKGAYMYVTSSQMAKDLGR